MGLRVCVCVCAQGPRKRALCSGAAARRACANQCIRAGGVAHGLDKALTSCPLPAYPSSPPRTPPPRCIARSPPTACVPAARPRLRAAMATRAVASSRLPFTKAKLRPACPFFEIPNLRASRFAARRDHGSGCRVGVGGLAKQEVGRCRGCQVRLRRRHAPFPLRSSGVRPRHGAGPHGRSWV